MTDLNQTILQKASGESRFHPDEQRLYLGTYRERVILTVTLEQARQEDVIAAFDELLDQALQQANPLTVKLSSQLSQSLQTFYMKQAQAKQVAFSLVNEAGNDSPYGIVLHTDHAINLDDIDVLEHLPKNTSTEGKSSEAPKKSFWSKLFGQSNN